MKKIIIIGLIVFLLIGIAGAEILLSKWSDKISLTSEQEAQVKASSGVKDINIKIGKISCDNKECWASVYQEGVIQTNWRRSKDYCSKMSECEVDKEGMLIDPECVEECLEYTDYTQEENKQAVKDYVEMRVGNWADAEISRAGKGNAEEKVDEGSLTAK